MISSPFSRLLTAALTVLPMCFFWVFCTESGTNAALHIFLPQWLANIEVGAVHGRLLDGQLLIESLETPTWSIKKLAIDLAFKPQWPPLQIRRLHLNKLTSQLPTNLNSPSSAPPIPNIHIDQWHIREWPLMKLNNLVLTQGPTWQLQCYLFDNPVQATWRIETLATNKNRLYLDLTYAKTTTRWRALQTPQGWHIQSEPHNSGHFTAWQRQNSWTVDVDEAIKLDEQHLIELKGFARQHDEQLTFTLEHLHVRLQEHHLHAKGQFSGRANDFEGQLRMRIDDSHLQWQGRLGDTLDIHTHWQIPSLTHFSSEWAGDLSAKAHITGPWQEPNIDAQLQSQHLRSRYLGSDDLNCVIHSKDRQNHLELDISGQSLTTANSRLELPWHVHLDKHGADINGRLNITDNQLKIKGRYHSNDLLDLRLIPETLSTPWVTRDTISFSYYINKQLFTLKPSCWHQGHNRACFSATITPEASHLHFDPFFMRGQLNTPLTFSDSAHLSVKNYQASGQLHLSHHKHWQLHGKCHAQAEGIPLHNAFANHILPGHLHFERFELENNDNEDGWHGSLSSGKDKLQLSLSQKPEEQTLTLKLHSPHFTLGKAPLFLELAHDSQLTFGFNKGQWTSHTDILGGQLHIKKMLTLAASSTDIHIDAPVILNQDNHAYWQMQHQLTFKQKVPLSMLGFSGLLSGQLNLKEDKTPLKASGQIKLNQGQFTLFGHSIDLKQAHLDYDGSSLYEPLVELYAKKTIVGKKEPTQGIMHIHGRGSNLYADINASPQALSTFEIVSNFFSGQKQADFNPEDDKHTLQWLSSILASQDLLPLMQLISDLEKQFHLDQITIFPDITASENLQDTLNATQITLGKALTPELSLRYQFQLHNQQNSKWSFIYQLPENLMLEMYFDPKDSGINILYQN